MKIKNKVSAKLYGSAVLSTLLLFSNCQKDENYTPDTSKTEVNLEESLDKLSAVKPLSVTSSSISSNVYRIENALPKGYVKDGSRDYTSYIQAAINKYGELAFPGFPLLINDKGLRIPSNRKIYFINGSELRLKPTSNQTYNIIDIRRASNITLISPVIKGDRNSHKGNSGEWGMGIAIRGSKNVTIQGAEIYDCWGDGIYINEYNGVNSADIKLSTIIANNNRRAGISICSVEGLLLESSYFGYNTGTEPMAGINFEAETSHAEFKDIRVQNIRTEYNGGYGIQIGLSNMLGTGKGKRISMDFYNFMDKGSKTGFKTACSLKHQKGNETISGEIKLDIPFWRNNPLRAFKTNLDKTDMKVVISRPKVTLMSGEYLGKDKAESFLWSTKGIINPIAKDNRLVAFK